MAISLVSSRQGRFGAAAWSADGSGPERAALGHQVPLFSNFSAYYYLASRDYGRIDRRSQGAAFGSGIESQFHNFSDALSNSPFSVRDLTLSFGLYSLGNDVRGRDWSLSGTNETRFYQGGRVVLKINGQPMVQAIAPKLTMAINYNTISEFLDDRIFGMTERIPRFTLVNNSSPQVRSLGRAFLNDVSEFGARFIFDNFQPSNQFDFAQNGRFGGFFEVTSMRLETGVAATRPSLNRLGVRIVDGNAQRNALGGSRGDDVIRGFDGDDVLRGQGGNDLLIGGNGNDRLLGGIGNDRLEGGIGNDRLEGGDGNDILLGGSGNDILVGGGGNDVLIGGRGVDILSGGLGSNSFVYESVQEGGDRILDFNPQRDVLDFRTMLNSPEFGARNPFRQYVRLVQRGARTVVAIDVDGDARRGGFQTFVILDAVNQNAINARHVLV
ncbi:MAG TPA: calcium-binding protein [Candidatus Obscuribacterales bacterium]